MSTAPSSQGRSFAIKGGGVALPPSSDKVQAKLDLAVSILIHRWTALSLAVQNLWGGPDSAEKRDWLGGAVSQLLDETSPQDMDVEYLEEFLLGVMQDELKVAVDDGSAEEVARDILKAKTQCEKGEFAEVDEMYKNWVEKGTGTLIKAVQREDEEESDGSEEDDEEEDDVQMTEAPELVRTKDKVLPKVDEEGFTEVVGKKRR